MSTSTRADPADSPLRTALGRIADAVILGALVLITAAPIVTITLALTAAVVVVERRPGDRGESVVTVFVRALRTHARRALVVGAVLAGVAAVVAVDALFVSAQPAGWPRTVVLVGAVLLGAAVVGTWVWVPLLVAHTEPAPASQVLRLSALFAFGRPLATLASVTAWMACVVITVAFPPTAPVSVALTMYLVVAVCHRQLKRSAADQ